MPSQHITEEEPSQTQGIMVPLELEGLCILRQEVQADGKLRVEVIARNCYDRTLGSCIVLACGIHLL
jgi:hypothetical protein